MIEIKWNRVIIIMITHIMLFHSWFFQNDWMLIKLDDHHWNEAFDVILNDHRWINDVNYISTFSFIIFLHFAWLIQFQRNDFQWFIHFMRDVNVNKRIFDAIIVYHCFNLIFILKIWRTIHNNWFIIEKIVFEVASIDFHYLHHIYLCSVCCRDYSFLDSFWLSLSDTCFSISRTKLLRLSFFDSEHRLAMCSDFSQL
jgi:hypothetical protein